RILSCPPRPANGRPQPTGPRADRAPVRSLRWLRCSVYRSDSSVFLRLLLLRLLLLRLLHPHCTRAATETSLRCTDTRRNASTTDGSKCVPRPDTMKATAWSCDIGSRYRRRDVMAS